jgi:hypothetical protein
MDFAGSFQTGFRWIVAVASWLVLGGLIIFIPIEITVWAAMAILLVVSTSSAISLLLVIENPDATLTEHRWIRTIAFVVSLVIPLGWALDFGLDAPLIAWPTYVLLAVFPTIVALQRSSNIRGRRQNLASTVPIERFVNRDQTKAVLPFPQLMQGEGADRLDDEDLEAMEATQDLMAFVSIFPWTSAMPPCISCFVLHSTAFPRFRPKIWTDAIWKFASLRRSNMGLV